MRSTEINAVLGLNQIHRLNGDIKKRRDNFNYFISHLDKEKYYTKFELEGNSNYAFVVIFNQRDYDIVEDYGLIVEQQDKRDALEQLLRDNKIEFRRGLSGGGNQLRQPYIQNNYNFDLNEFPVVEHIHQFSWYIGNYPSLERHKIDKLLDLLNNL
jgi:CDP-6-deoxy-D-xylo-4-hexulose-3-dehydrase